MRAFKHLYPRICDWHNLVLVWRKARRNKRYTPAAARFELNLDRELLSLQRDLEEETYRPGESAGRARPRKRANIE